MTPIDIFLWAFGASVAVEVYNAISFYTKSEVLPSRYRNPVFLFLRLVLACIAGGLAVAQDANTKLLAVHIGAATPLILEGLTKAVPTVGENSTGQTAGMTPEKSGA